MHIFFDIFNRALRYESFSSTLEFWKNSGKVGNFYSSTEHSLVSQWILFWCSILHGFRKTISAVLWLNNLSVSLPLNYFYSCLGDINLLEGANLPVAAHEWILSDTCGGVDYFVPNTALSAGSPMMLNSATSAQSWSQFFGNAFTYYDLQINASQIVVDLSTPLSVFYWFKPLSNVTSFTVVELRYSLSGMSQVLSIYYANNSFNYNANFYGKFCH